MVGPSKVVARVEQRILRPGEQLVGLVLDNSPAIESGLEPGGAGDETAQWLAKQRGFDPEERLPCGVLVLTDSRLVSVRWPIKDEPELYADIPVPGPRLTYAERRGRLYWRTYLLVELGGGRFTTVVVQPRSFGMTATKTKAGLEALIAGLGDAAQRIDLQTAP